MRKWMIVCACITALITCGCKKTQETVPPEPTASPAPTVLVETALSGNVEVLPVPMTASAVFARARQYGEERSLIADGNGFTGRLRYPAGNVFPINKAVADWAGDTFLRLEKQAATETPDEDGLRAVADVDYDAYAYNDRFVGIKLTGAYLAVVSGRVDPVLYAFNYDLEKCQPLTLTNVIDQARLADVCALLTERLGWRGATALPDAGELNAETMQNFVIRNDGIEWLFPGETDVVGVLLDYAVLEPHLIMNEPASENNAATMAAGDVVIVEQQATCLFDGVQLRSLPSFTGEGGVICMVDAGTVLDVVDSNAVKGWHKVHHDGIFLYVDANLVELALDDVKPVKGWVISAYAHVRDRASVDGALLSTMQFQEPVHVLDTTAIDGWYKIMFEGKIAYVNAQYVLLDNYPSETQLTYAAKAVQERTEAPRILWQIPAPIVGVGVCKTDGAIIRSGPYGSAPLLGTLRQGEQVYIMEEEFASGWDRIFVYTEANKGYYGFVQACSVDSRVADEAACDTAGAFLP